MEFPRPLTDNDAFYRAVNPDCHLKNDGTLSSALFQNTRGQDSMSVDWSELSTPQQVLDRFPDWSPEKYVVSLTAKDYWDACQKICYEPTCKNPAHTHIVGKKQSRVKRMLVKQAKDTRLSQQ